MVFVQTRGPNKDEVTRGRRKLHTEELHNMNSSRKIARDIKSRCMRWAVHVACVGELKSAYKILVGKPEENGRLRRPWQDITAKNLQEKGVKVWTGFSWLRTGDSSENL
jgi:hypothetical protein